MKKYFQRPWSLSLFLYYFGQFIFYFFAFFIALTIGTITAKGLFIYCKFIWNLL